MKIAVLYICTGNYIVFWKDFFTSAEKFMLPQHEKHYFVFTDCVDLDFQNNSHVHKIHQQKLGWPYDTLMRFNMFSKIENDLLNFDYIYFFNANMMFVDYVGEEIFPNDSENGLVAAIHPGYYNRTNAKKYPYDRNPKSTAYIPYGKGKHYFPGGFNGGKAAAYLQLIKELNQNIKTDERNNVVALWHDESHLNKYFLDKHIKVLSPSYLYPEDSGIKFPVKILLKDKGKWGGHNFLRDVKNKTFLTDFLEKIKKHFSTNK